MEEDIIMRLSEIKKIVEENKDLLNFNVEGHPKDGNLRFVTGVQSILQAIHNLKVINSLGSIINQLESVPEISSIYTNEKVTVSTANANSFNAYLSSLKIKCDTILDIANDILPSMDENTICIKLPPETDLKMLSAISINFSSFFDTLLISAKIEGSITFGGVEAGCSWLYITVAGAQTFILLAPQIINTIYSAYDKYIKMKALKLQMKQLEIETDAISDIGKLHHTFCKKELQLLSDNNSLSLNDETIDKLTRNVEKLTLLLEKGMEIHPAITAPIETQKIANKRISQLKEQTKELELLEAPKESDDNTSSSKDEDGEPTDEQN